MIKLEFPTDCDAQHGAYYLQDRGYSVRLMGKAWWYAGRTPQTWRW